MLLVQLSQRLAHNTIWFLATVDTGSLAQSLGTDVTPILRPPEVGL